MRNLRDFKNNKKGIVAVVAVGVMTMIVATLAWLVLMVVTNQFVDTFGAMATSAIVIQLGDTVRNQGGIVIAIIDIGIPIWLITSAFRKETQEDTSGMGF